MAKYLIGASQIDGLGLGLIVGAMPIAQGEKILSEAAMLSLPQKVEQPAFGIAIDVFLDQLTNLKDTDIHRLRLIALKHGLIDKALSDEFVPRIRDKTEAAVKAASQAFFDTSCKFRSSTSVQEGMFKDLHMLNHSCLPNAVRFWNDAEQKMEVRAMTTITPGQEILVSHIDPLQSRNVRRARLQRECKCNVCTNHGEPFGRYEQNNELVRESLEVMEQFERKHLRNEGTDVRNEDEIVQIVQEPEATEAVTAAKTAAGVLEQHGLIDWQLARAYRILYTVHICRCICSDNDSDLYKTAVTHKMWEWHTIAVCRGIKHASARDTLRHLMLTIKAAPNPDVQREITDRLARLLKTLHSILELTRLDQEIIGFKVIIKDGVSDEQETMEINP